MVKLLELFSKEIISKQEMGLLLMKGIEVIDENNINQAKDILNEEQISAIEEMMAVKPEDEMEELIREYIEREQRKPVKVYEEDGYVVGHQYNIIAQIGTAKYRDAHVRVSKKEGYLYYGSLWFETKYGKRSINYEMDTNRNIFFNRNINKLYYYDLINLTRKVISWFEEHMNNAEEIDLDAIDKAIENIFE